VLIDSRANPADRLFFGSGLVFHPLSHTLTRPQIIRPKNCCPKTDRTLLFAKISAPGGSRSKASTQRSTSRHCSEWRQCIVDIDIWSGASPSVREQNRQGELSFDSETTYPSCTSVVAAPRAQGPTVVEITGMPHDSNSCSNGCLTFGSIFPRALITDTGGTNSIILATRYCSFRSMYT
jgi:hypothetical protein